MRVNSIKKQISNYGQLSSAAKLMLRYVNMDDGIRNVITSVDGIDILSLGAVVSDSIVDSGRQNPLFGLGCSENRIVKCELNNQTITFYVAIDGSADGVFTNVTTDKSKSFKW